MLHNTIIFEYTLCVKGDCSCLMTTPTTFIKEIYHFLSNDTFLIVIFGSIGLPKSTLVHSPHKITLLFNLSYRLYIHCEFLPKSLSIGLILKYCMP